MNGDEGRFYDQVRMTKPTFMALCTELVSRGFLSYGQTARVSVYEEVILFMQTVGMHHRHRDSMERFQHSSETINRHIKRVLEALVNFASEVITPPKFNEVSSVITSNPLLYPYFKDCVGAIDGTIIPAWVPRSRQNSYRSRRNTISQNVLAICDFDLMFTYVYAGWEGSANDAHVLMNAINSDTSFPFPPAGKYYLVDAGYTNYGCFLAPYRQERYHISEFRGQGRGPTRKKEIFNHRHSKLRNAIERCFGILKKRFPIIAWGMPSYAVKRQVKIVIACCVLHNFIRKFNRDDNIFNMTDAQLREVLDGEDNTQRYSNPTVQEIQMQSSFRDSIADWMWGDLGN